MFIFPNETGNKVLEGEGFWKGRGRSDLRGSRDREKVEQGSKAAQEPRPGQLRQTTVEQDCGWPPRGLGTSHPNRLGCLGEHWKEWQTKEVSTQRAPRLLPVHRAQPGEGRGSEEDEARQHIQTQTLRQLPAETSWDVSSD